MRELSGGLLLLILLCSGSTSGAEPFRFEGGSKLPLIIVDTAGKSISDEPKIDATMSIINGSETNRLSDAATAVTKIRIEVRGASSQMFDKKSYGFETVGASGKDKDKSLLGLPPESDWILYGPHSDKTLMRNYLAFHLSNKIGRYAPRTRFAEVFLMDSKGPLKEKYVGVYLLVEKIKRGDERVDVSRLKQRGKKSKRKLSGGYILKIDRLDGPESYFTSELGTVLGHVSPRGDRLDDERRSWIRRDFSRIERSLATNDFRDSENGYARYIDAGSFIDYFLLNELFKNVDAYFLSTFLHKRDGRLHMGPIWDLNLSAGNASYGGVWHAEGWMLFPEDTRRASTRVFWWDRLFEDPSFRAKLIARWRELRQGDFAPDAILAQIDATAARLEDAQRRNFQRWPVLGNYVWPNPRPYAKTYTGEIRQLKDWFAKRIDWMDANIESLAAQPRRTP